MSDHLRLAASTPEVEVAWAAYDAAALKLHRAYRAAEMYADSPENRQERMAQAVEVVRLWEAFRLLFAGGDEPRPAA